MAEPRHLQRARWLQPRRAAARWLVCDVGHVTDPDLSTIDELARIGLSARRLGCRAQLHNTSSALEDLLSLSGLTDLFGYARVSDLEPQWQSEGGKESRGVKEERDPGDASI